MKTLKLFLMATGVLFTSLTFQSCLDDDDNYYYGYLTPNALVTVKPVSDNSFFLQLDDSTTLLPANLTSSPTEIKKWIDSILTKQIAPDLGVDNDSVYGTDPVEMIKDWVTIAEDGYLTLRFRTLWGDRSKAHFVNLLVSKDPANPYEVEFRHNAYGDVYGTEGDGLVAFKLDELPDTEGKTVKLKLKWKSFSGDKSAEFDYCTRKSTPAKVEITGDKSVLNLK